MGGQARELVNVPPVEDRRIDAIKRKLDSMDSKLESILRAMADQTDERRRGDTERTSANVTEETIKPAEIIKVVESKKKTIDRTK